MADAKKTFMKTIDNLYYVLDILGFKIKKNWKIMQ